ncbi:hypothetical protein E2562_039147 [Oryza meyeriana var. granulata]|uniref:Uncharacterized protein n=1 Tax=Oryza meyeriana var. granulata TaxID=110450 RepID=A0A6G1DT87_9ORYZ|nr:hypothetical protein E2562_039147 [Oryza meyeriana var. granulata]
MLPPLALAMRSPVLPRSVPQQRLLCRMRTTPPPLVTIADSSACCCGFPTTNAGTTMCGRVASSRLAYTAPCGSVSWCSCLDVASSFGFLRTATCGSRHHPGLFLE